MSDLPFDTSLPPTNRLDLGSLAGCAVLIAIGGCHPNVVMKHSPAGKAVVRACLVVLNGPEQGTEYIDTLILNNQPVRTLRGRAGHAHVAHVDLDRSFTNPAVVLLDPSPEEAELAGAWHRANPERTAELIQLAVAAYNIAEERMGNPHGSQSPPAPASARTPPPANPAPSSPPPLGPDHGRTQPAVAPTPGGPPPPPPRPASLPTGQPYEVAVDTEPPF